MSVHYGKTFRSGNSVAVRLPKDLGFDPGIEVEIQRTGDLLSIRPKPRMSPSELVEALRQLPKPKRVQKREKFIAPRRQGL